MIDGQLKKFHGDLVCSPMVESKEDELRDRTQRPNPINVWGIHYRGLLVTTLWTASPRGARSLVRLLSPFDGDKHGT